MRGDLVDLLCFYAVFTRIWGIWLYPGISNPDSCSSPSSVWTSVVVAYVTHILKYYMRWKSVSHEVLGRLTPNH